jgi:hypothetical protein
MPSRSARNRRARNARTQPVVRGVVGVHTPARPIANSPHDHDHTVSIRCVGYLGRNRTSVHYSGSATGGYESEWGRDGWDFFTDPRWDQTLSSQHVGEGGFR